MISNFLAIFATITITLTICSSSGRVQAEEYVYETHFYETQLDHFSFTTNLTFQLKYLQNDSWWSRDDDESGHSGPIFFYTGNEGDIELFAQNTGLMWDSAPEFKALLLFVEHRYYGSSLPFGNQSFQDPTRSGFLTSEQALADFAAFISWFKAKNNASSSPVIAFGGSYGGMLTAWLRMKYPHIVQGGIAGSAPILQFTDITACDVFGKIVTADFAKESKECVETVRNSWAVINSFGNTHLGREWLTHNWKLCNPITNQAGVDELKNWLVDVYGNLAMVDYPYESSFLAPLPPYPVRAVCEKLVDSSLPGKQLLKSLFKGLSVYFNYTGQASCLDVAAEATSALGDEGWDYQACTEMVMPMCYDGVSDFFEPTPWDPESYASTCWAKWQVKPAPYMAQLMYGGSGREISSASNIVFSNGLLDPWSGGGVMKNLSDSLIAVIIPEGAHHLDLRGANPSDPASVVNARAIEKQNIKKWIQEYRLQRK